MTDLFLAGVFALLGVVLIAVPAFSPPPPDPTAEAIGIVSYVIGFGAIGLSVAVVVVG